jgi:N utilization substance protein B
MGKRSTARRLAMQILFSADLGQGEIEPAAKSVLSEDEYIEDTRVFALKLARGVWQNKNEIDAIISRQTIGWPLDRMSTVDRNILRLAIYELNYQNETPASVVINEAVELSKKFGTEESPKFINGILGALTKK